MMMLLMMTMMIVMVLMAILAVGGLMMMITFEITYMYRVRTLLSSSNPCLSKTISSFS